jgi:hypothetical protein
MQEVWRVEKQSTYFIAVPDTVASIQIYRDSGNVFERARSTDRLSAGARAVDMPARSGPVTPIPKLYVGWVSHQSFTKREATETHTASGNRPWVRSG